MKRKNISDAMDMLDDELLETAAAMRGKKRARRFSVSKLVVIAAAVILALSLTVLAVAETYRFDVDPKTASRAIKTAYEYTIHNSEDLNEQKYLIYCWDDYHYDEAVEGKVSGLRPVYNVTFKVAGYVYDIDVDTKTSIVTRCKKDIDPEWESHFDDYEGFEKMFNNWLISIGEKEPEVTVGDVNYKMAYTIFQDYFGLDYRCSTEGSYLQATSLSFAYTFDYSTDPMTYCMSFEHDGYIYECRINSVTGEVTDDNIAKVPTNELDHPTLIHAHAHDDNYEFIGAYRANLIALEAIGLTPEDYWDTSPMLYVLGKDGGGGRVKLNGDPLDIPEDVDAYYFWKKHNVGELDINIIIDARTGEIYLIDESDEYTIYFEGEIANTIPSALAPEGMISEADAQIIILEDLGLKDKDELYGFEIELVDGAYEVTTGYYDNIKILKCQYSIDATSGEILKKDIFDWPEEN